MEALVAASPQGSQEVEDEVKSLVVMITTKTPEGVAAAGAGIVVGIEKDRIYVATAAHVVRQNAQVPQDLEVKFRWLTRTFKASLLKYVEPPLDLAVLGVTGVTLPTGETPAVPFDHLGDVAALNPGDPVYSLGNPRGEGWTVNATPDRFLRRDDILLYYGSDFIAGGHSGGALLNARWELVGMIVGDNPPTGRAVNIARILATLREWKYPVGLHLPSPRISAGYERTCVSMPSGLAHCWGNIEFEDPNPSVGVMPLGRVRLKSVTAGMFHVCGIAFSGAAFCWGSNKSGQLGNGTNTGSSESGVPVQGGLIFTSLSAGGWHTCGITPDGSAHCWGAGEGGRLGNDAGEESHVPVPVAGGLTFKSISAGLMNSCGITADGAAYCWGGILGTGLPRAGTDPPNAFVPLAVSGKLTFRSVSAGEYHACGVTHSGSAYCWGSNDKGQLGNRSNKDSFAPRRVSGQLTFKAVSGGGSHTCGLTTSGVAYCWGRNEDGELGNGTKTDNNVPVAVAGGLTFASVSAGYNHTCGVTTDDSIYCWGADRLEAEVGAGFGTGSKTGSTRPIRVPKMP